MPHTINPLPRRFALRASAALVALALTGCISLGGKVPASLLTLHSAAAPAVDAVRSGNPQSALTVIIPSVPQKLRTPRVPVQSGATSLAYLKDAQWIEPPAHLFQRLLSETLAAHSNRLVLTESELVTGSGEMLAGDLLEFGVDADRHEAVVTFQALRLQGDGSRIAQRRFEAREPLATIEAAPAGEALNRAANRVAAQVTEWLDSPAQ